jgi:hypothetical protein
MQALRQNQGRPRFKPINACLNGNAGRVQRFMDMNQIQGDLNNRWVRAWQRKGSPCGLLFHI